MALYRRGADRDDGFTELTVVRAPSVQDEDAPVAEGEVRYATLREKRINDDALPDASGSFGYEYRDSIEIDCNSYGECPVTLFVGCDDLLAVVMGGTFAGLGPISSSVLHEGRRWFDLSSDVRGESMVSETEQDERGEVMGYSEALRYGPEGYRAFENAFDILSAECLELRAAEDHEAAMRRCADAGRLARMKVDRGRLFREAALAAEAIGSLGEAAEWMRLAMDDLEAWEDPEMLEQRWRIGLAHCRAAEAGSHYDICQHTEDAVRNEADRALLYVVMGEHAEAQEDTRAALRHYREALELTPNDEAIRARIERLENP